MSNRVVEYKCPCCDAGLVFGEDSQTMKCHYCENTFDLDTVRTYNEQLEAADSCSIDWQTETQAFWSDAETETLKTYVCPACAGEIVTDENTAATFCPYCGNPTILPGRLSGKIKPDAIIPFSTGKEEAKAAFLKLCKGKPLLPKAFTEKQQIEKITGMYVPFWLYDCQADYGVHYKATRVHHWSDANYTYTKTDHFQLRRRADAEFLRIPMDGSRKMDDAIMESIEPYDYTKLVDFNMAYLSGFFAEKYDVESSEGENRIRQRVNSSMESLVRQSVIGYATAVPINQQLKIQNSTAKYALLPVWMLTTRYKDQLYTFAMNGQTGKMTGAFPICPQRTAVWFGGIFAGVTALAALIQLLFL